MSGQVQFLKDFLILLQFLFQCGYWKVNTEKKRVSWAFRQRKLYYRKRESTMVVTQLPTAPLLLLPGEMGVGVASVNAYSRWKLSPVRDIRHNTHFPLFSDDNHTK